MLGSPREARHGEPRYRNGKQPNMARLYRMHSATNRRRAWPGATQELPMTASTAPRWPVRYLLFIGGLGGLLYGIDIGIIAGALPYLEATASHAWQLSSQQLGFVVAAVLLGSVLSSLFAGMVADLIGRRGAMLLAGLLFTASIPIMALASGYTPLLLGRLLQGISGGLIGVVIPLYLAEVLSPERRGRGAAMFQLLLTIGLVLAALIGLYHAHAVDAAAEAVRSLPLAQQAQELFTVKDQAWRTIFWSCLAPGLLFCAGIFWLSESPRWLVRRGRVDDARRSLQRVLPAADVEPTLAQIQAPESSSSDGKRDPLLSRRYVVPFVRGAGLHPGHRHQFGAGVRGEHPQPGRPVRLGGQRRRRGDQAAQRGDDRGRAAGRPQGPQVPADARQRRHLRGPAGCRHAVLPGRAWPRRRAAATAGGGQATACGWCWTTHSGSAWAVA